MKPWMDNGSSASWSEIPGQHLVFCFASMETLTSPHGSSIGHGLWSVIPDTLFSSPNTAGTCHLVEVPRTRARSSMPVLPMTIFESPLVLIARAWHSSVIPLAAPLRQSLQKFIRLLHCFSSRLSLRRVQWRDLS